MRKYFLLLLLFLPFTFSFAQEVKTTARRVDSIKFFTDEKPIEMTLTTDMKKLIANKLKMTEQPAVVSIRFPDDTTTFTGHVTIRARGITRKETCYMPPTMIDFRKAGTSSLSSLHKLKLVSACSNSSEDEKLALKEYLVYKMYNFLTDMSFRVRLAHITYQDTKKSYSQYGFLIEDIDALAKRNHCKEIQKIAYAQEGTNRAQMTLVSLFEYMIGNTDWSVPNYHNIKLLQPKHDSTAKPSVVPYDYDYCGFVNAYYAVTNEVVGTDPVTVRVYRGFARSMDELEQAIKIFNDNKENIKNLIMNFEPFSSKYRSETIDYIEQFYKIINNKNQVEQEFIRGARTN